MIASDVVRACTIGALAALVLTGRFRLWQILVGAFIEGGASTFFNSGQAGALRSVVARTQLPAAAGAQEGRRSLVRLGGPPLGGVLFSISRAVPFLFDALSYSFSTAALLMMRTPFQEKRSATRRGFRQEIAEGFHFLWRQPFLRTTTFLYGIGNFVAPGMLLLIVLVGRQQGLPPSTIGVLSAAVGVGTLIGSSASPLLRRFLAPRTIMLLELSTWLGSWLFLAWPTVYVIAAVVLLFGVAAPVTDSVVVGYRLAITPDPLVGRVESVRSNMSLLIAPVGPLLAGILLDATSARTTVAVFAASALTLQIWGFSSRSLRAPLSLEEPDDSA
jgi:hypothetical protein